MYQFHAQVLFDSAYMNRFGARKGFNLVYWSLRKIKKRLVKQQREMLETLSQLEIGERKGVVSPLDICAPFWAAGRRD